MAFSRRASTPAKQTHCRRFPAASRIPASRLNLAGRNLDSKAVCRSHACQSYPAVSQGRRELSSGADPGGGTGVPPGDDEGDPQAQGDRSPSGGTEIQDRQDQEGAGRREEQRQEDPRAAHPSAGGRHRNPARRPERRQEPIDRQSDPGNARGGALSVHHDGPAPP